MTTNITEPLDVDLITAFRQEDTVRRVITIELREGGPTVTPAHGGFTMIAREVTILYVKDLNHWQFGIVTVSGPPTDDHRGEPLIYTGHHRIVDFRFVAELAPLPWLDKLVHDHWPADRLPDPPDPASPTHAAQ